MDEGKEVIVGNYSIQFIRKAIKNIHLRVLPGAKITISAPLRLDEKIITSFARSKLGWIQKQVKRLLNSSSVPPKKYLTGETHYVRGSRCELTVFDKHTDSAVIIEAGRINLYTGKRNNLESRRKILMEWYRTDLQSRLGSLLAKWQAILNVEVHEIGIRQMRSRWGSCHMRKHKVVFNLELAKRSDRCLELVVVHELVHLLEPSHNKRFYALMTQFLPEWKVYHQELITPLVY